MTIHSAHWGAFHPRVEDGRLVAADPFAADRDPSELLHSVPGAVHARNRVVRPAVRSSWWEGRRGRRGADPFVEVDWDTALDLVADALRSTYDRHGAAVGVRRLLRVVERRAPAPREDPAEPLPGLRRWVHRLRHELQLRRRRTPAALRRRRRRQRHRVRRVVGRHRRVHRHDPDARRSPGQEPPAGVRGHGRPHRPGRAPAGARRGHADHQRQPGAQRRSGAPRRHLGADPSEQRHRAAPRAHARAGRARAGRPRLPRPLHRRLAAAAGLRARGDRRRGEDPAVGRGRHRGSGGDDADDRRSARGRPEPGHGDLGAATGRARRAALLGGDRARRLPGPDRAARRRLRVRVRQHGRGRRRSPPLRHPRVPGAAQPVRRADTGGPVDRPAQRPGRQLRVRRGHAPLPRHPPRLLGGRQPVPPPPGPQPARARPGSARTRSW